MAFRVTVTEFNFKTQDGFTLGGVFINGSGEHLGDHYHIEVKNENLVARLNDNVDVTIPDLICCLDMDSLTPITNPNFAQQMNVAIVVLPAPKEFTTERGLQAFGPAYVGINTPYTPAVAKHFNRNKGQ